jgi:tRNA-binding EMAP/Myf-like protein
VDPVADFSNVVVAEIEACSPHPADKLSVCRSTMAPERLQSVWAPNARAGLRYPRPCRRADRARFPHQESETQGVDSSMLCSARELGFRMIIQA